jgi:hypothetical protein
MGIGTVLVCGVRVRGQRKSEASGSRHRRPRRRSSSGAPTSAPFSSRTGATPYYTRAHSHWRASYFGDGASSSTMGVSGLEAEQAGPRAVGKETPVERLAPAHPHTRRPPRDITVPRTCAVFEEGGRTGVIVRTRPNARRWELESTAGAEKAGRDAAGSSIYFFACVVRTLVGAAAYITYSLATPADVPRNQNQLIGIALYPTCTSVSISRSARNAARKETLRLLLRAPLLGELPQDEKMPQLRGCLLWLLLLCISSSLCTPAHCLWSFVCVLAKRHRFSLDPNSPRL